jgi:HK97 family phage major capsid protein
MSAHASHGYWTREDSPARQRLQEALARLQPGQRLRLADVLRGRVEPADGDHAQRAAHDDAPPLVEYTSTSLRGKRVDEQTREVEFSFSSEEPYERWWGVEILGHDRGECDLSWVASGRAPFLNNHRSDQQIGVISRAWLDPQTRKNRCVARFGRTALAEEQMAEAQDDIRVNVSVGYEIDELELLKKDNDIPTYRVTAWRPLEVSLVSIPADMTVGLGRMVEDAITPPAPQRATVPATPRMEHTMETTTQAPVQGDAAFRKNVETIQRLAREYGEWLKPTDVGDAIANGADAERFHDLILQRLKTSATDATTLAGIGATPKEARRYSFMRAIQAQMQGHGPSVDAGFEREVSQAIAKMTGREAEGIFVPADVMFSDLHGREPGEKRDFNVGTANQAGNLVQTTVDAAMWTDVLRPALVLMQAGCTVLPGLRGNLAVPRKTVAGTLGMLTEVAAATETQPTTALPVLTPKRVASYVEPSKQAIIQSEIGIEAMLRQDLVDGAAVLMEDQGINGNGSGANARGIRNVSGIGSVVGGTNGAELAWTHVVGLESAAANANAVNTSRSGYLTNTKVRGKAKVVQKAANLPFIWDDGDFPLNGHRAMVTNNVPSNLTKGSSSGICSSMVFSADWSMFVLGLFGGLDVTVDPYSLAATGQVRITLNQFFDWLCRQPGAFSSIDDLLTT